MRAPPAACTGQPLRRLAGLLSLLGILLVMTACSSEKAEQNSAERAAQERAALDAYLAEYEQQQNAARTEEGTENDPRLNPNARLKSSTANNPVAHDFEQWAQSVELESATQGVLEKPYLPDPKQLGGVSWQRLKRMAEKSGAQNPMLTDPKLTETLRKTASDNASEP